MLIDLDASFVDQVRSFKDYCDHFLESSSGTFQDYVMGYRDALSSVLDLIDFVKSGTIKFS